MPFDPLDATPVRQLFPRKTTKCHIYRNQHIRLVYIKYFILTPDAHNRYEDLGPDIVKTCACATLLPITHERTLHYPPEVTPDPVTTQPPFWVRIQNTRKHCKLVHRLEAAHKFDHVVQTVTSTYLVRSTEVALATHLCENLRDRCSCPRLFDGEIFDEIIQAPARLSFTCIRTPERTNPAET